MICGLREGIKTPDSKIIAPSGSAGELSSEQPCPVDPVEEYPQIELITMASRY